MEQIKIYVEGETDKKFISDYLNHLNITFNNDQIRIINGKSESHFILQSRAFNLKAPNLFILDSDNDDIKSRKEEIQDILTSFNAQAQIFLYPNDKDNGTFEDLLRMMVWPKYAGFFECYKHLNHCISESNTDFFTLDKKDEIYAYLSALLTKQERYQRADFLHFTRKPSKNKPDAPSYMQTRFWDIESPAIQPLKQFLQKYFTA
jgi:hypothetical protein